MFIGWTNTIANMPAWGAVDAKLGNNPLVMALPFHEEAIVLIWPCLSSRLARSKIMHWSNNSCRYREDMIPMAPYHDPAAILASRRVLPVGYWKGAGLSLLLDIFATILSAGLSTAAITRNGEERSVSQVFICIDPDKLSKGNSLAETVTNMLKNYRESVTGKNAVVSYPGERVLRVRAENEQNGIPVNEAVWNNILQL